MKGKDEIKELFSDKLGSFEAQVSPELWTNIASQIGSSSTVGASTGMSLLTKTIISIGVISTAVITTVLLITPNDELNAKAKTSKVVSQPDITDPIAVSKETKKASIKIEKEKEESLTRESAIDIPVFEPKGLDQSKKLNTGASVVRELKEREERNIFEKTQETTKPTEKNKTLEERGVSESTNKLIEENTIVGPPSVEKAYKLGELPNIFTPNRDGSNDILFIESEGLIDFTIVVLDINQKVVFESNDPDFEWDGTDKAGNIVSPGSYGYYIIAMDEKGNKVNRFISLEVRL